MNEWPEDDAMFDDRADLAWLERLLDGADPADGVDREEAPASCAGLADVLLAARAPASPDDFAGEAAVRAMFRSLVAGEAAERRPFARRAKVIAVAASLGATAMTGAAAAAGRLPADVQDMASQVLDRIGIHVPAAERGDGLLEVPIDGPADVARGLGAGAADAPIGRLPSSLPSTRSGFEDRSAGVVDTLLAPGLPAAAPDLPQEAPTDAAAASAPAIDALAPVPDGTAPVTAREAAAVASTPAPAAEAIPASAGAPSDAPDPPAAPTAPAAPVEEPTPPADHGQQGAPGVEPARPEPLGAGRGHAGAPAGPPAGVPADPPASPPAGPRADVPADPPGRPDGVGPPADLPAARGALPSATPGRPDGVGPPAAAVDPPGPPARP